MVNQTVISCHHFSEHEEYGNQGWLKVARCSNQAEIHQIPRGVLLLYRDERRSVLSALSSFPHWNGLFLGIPHFLTGPFGATLGIAKKNISQLTFIFWRVVASHHQAANFSGFFLIWFNMIRKNCCKRISLINFSPPKIGVNFDPEPSSRTLFPVDLEIIEVFQRASSFLPRWWIWRRCL